MGSTWNPLTALQLIFAFFLGLMITAFIGVGVHTFFPDRLEPFDEQTRILRDERQLIVDGRGIHGLTEEQKAEVSALNEQLRETARSRRTEQQAWARTSSIILLALATLVMGISLVRADQLPVINNGLLLGGIFSMLYGTGWILSSGESVTRFLALGFALLVTLVLGYVRFVHGRSATPGPAPHAAREDNLASRLTELDRRVRAAAEIMRHPS
jgi:cbb3-type cytochrome oxidase subunit 3